MTPEQASIIGKSADPCGPPETNSGRARGATLRRQGREAPVGAEEPPTTCDDIDATEPIMQPQRLCAPFNGHEIRGDKLNPRKTGLFAVARTVAPSRCSWFATA
jgi:hypothetical protein